MFFFSMVSCYKVIHFIFFWSMVIHRTTDGGSVTWYEPRPVETTSDDNKELTADSRQLLKGSPNVLLNWNFSLTPDLNLITVVLTLNSVDIATVAPPTGNAGPATGFEGRFNVTWISQRATLIIFSVTEDDDGEFGCKLNTFQGAQNKIWERKMKVEVVVPASLTNVSPDQTVQEGSMLRLLCEADGEPPSNITWTRVLEDGSNSTVLHQGSTLDFSNITRNASGAYRCTAYNRIGYPVSREVKVNVTYPAKVVNVSARKHDVKVQESVSLYCKAEGNPQPTYTWEPCGPPQHACHQNTLNVSEVLYDEVYICTAANSLGTNSGNVSVFIAGNVINITLVITSESCTDEKYNETSLWTKLNKTINEAFANESRYISAQLIDVRCGSVSIDLALNFNSTIREREVIDILRDAAEDGTLGEFTVNASSIMGTRPVVENPTKAATTSPSSSPGSKTWIIVGAVLGSLALLAVAVVVGWFVYRKRKCKKRDTKVHNNGSHEDTGGNVPSEGYVEVNKGYGGKRSSVPPIIYDTAQTSNRAAVKEPPQPPQYSVVDKSKKNPKKRKPGELQYAELAEFSTGQGGPRTSTSPTYHPTETQYADVNAM